MSLGQDAREIHVGPGRIFINVTAPPSTLPRTLMTHVEGEPATGDEVGHTTGPTVATYTLTKADIESEQAFGVIDSYATAQSIEMTFTARQQNYELRRRLMEGLHAAKQGGAQVFTGGGQPAIESFSICIISPRRGDPSRFQVLTIYKAQVVSPVPFTFSRTDISDTPVTIRGVHDTSRMHNDQMFQHYIEDYAGTEPATMTSSSVASPTVITTAAPHGFISGQSVVIAGHTGSTPDINGTHVVTVTGPSTFTIPVAVTVAGTGGTATPV